MKFDSDIHVPLRMNFNTFGDPLTFLSSVQSLVYDQIPAKINDISINLRKRSHANTLNEES